METETLAIVHDGALTIRGAVEHSGIGRTELYRLMNAGEMAFIKHGKRRLIPRSELRRVLAKDVVPAKVQTA